MKLACPSSSCLKVAVLSLARRKLKNKQNSDTLITVIQRDLLVLLLTLKKAQFEKRVAKSVVKEIK